MLDRLKIGYQNVDVKYIDRTGHHHDASYDSRSHVIRIINDYPNKIEEANSLIHECLHAVWFTQGLDQVARKIASPDFEEIIVNSLANGITQIFVDNPKLMDWLKEKMNA